MAVLAFQIQNPPVFLECLVLPGTVAFLVVSGGHAGAPPWAEAIAPAAAVVANMLTYSLATVGISKIVQLIIRKEDNL